MVHVFLHYRGSGQQDLALLAVGQFLVGAGLHDLDIGVGEGQADGAFLIHGGGGEAAGRDGLRGAVALPHLNDGVVVIEELVEFLFQLNGQAVAAGEHALEAGEVGIAHAGQAQQRLVQGGHARNKVALILHDLLGVAFGGEAGDEDATSAAGQHGVHAHAQAEAVEQGHGRQHPVAGAEHGVGGDDLLGQGVKVAVGEHNALGSSGGAAGVEDHGRVVGLAIHAEVLIEAVAAQIHELPPPDHGGVFGDLLDLAPLGEHVARPHGLAQCVLHGGNDDVHDAGVLADVLKLVVELIQRDGGDGLGFVEVELNLLFSRQGMDHVGDAAHQIHGVEHVDGLRAVGHGDGDAVAGADAQHLQALGAALDLLDHFAVGGGLAHEVKGDVVGVLLRHQLQRLEHGAAEIFQMHGHVTHVGGPRGFHFTHTALPPS